LRREPGREVYEKSRFYKKISRDFYLELKGSAKAWLVEGW
jgi:hypothetical protein